MHYYQFNIGDYAKRTRHLTNAEDLAYRRLIDLYYTNESPMPDDVNQIARLISMRENIDEITNVLSDFFTLDNGFWINKRADEEINKYHSKADAARANGKKGGRPKNPDKTQSVNSANPEETGSKANQEPITINHKPITNNKDLSPNGSINKVDNCPHDQIAKLYMEILPELPRVAKLTDKRKKSLGAAWRSDIKCQSLDFWKGYFEVVSQSNFLMGKTSSWMADFDFVINQNKMIKIIEGAYE